MNWKWLGGHPKSSCSRNLTAGTIFNSDSARVSVALFTSGAACEGNAPFLVVELQRISRCQALAAICFRGKRALRERFDTRPKSTA